MIRLIGRQIAATIGGARVRASRRNKNHKRSTDMPSPANERRKKRYAEDKEFRAKTCADKRTWYAANKDRINAENRQIAHAVAQCGAQTWAATMGRIPASVNFGSCAINPPGARSRAATKMRFQLSRRKPLTPTNNTGGSSP